MNQFLRDGKMTDLDTYRRMGHLVREPRKERGMKTFFKQFGLLGGLGTLFITGFVVLDNFVHYYTPVYWFVLWMAGGCAWALTTKSPK